MPQVSKRLLDKNVEIKVKEVFLEVLSNLKDKTETYRFIYDFLTPTEQVMLAKRLAIALMIYKGYNHREISDVLKVSTSTVSIIATWMRYEGKGYRQVLAKVFNKEAWKEIWHKIDDDLERPIAPQTEDKEELSEFYKKRYQNQPIKTPLGMVKKV